MLASLSSQRWPRQRLVLAYVLYLLAVLIGSVPGARAEMAHYASGLVLHSLAYAGLAWLLATGYAGPFRVRAGKALASVAGMGALDEFVQSFFPYRHATVGDWLVDVSAATLALILLWLASKSKDAGPSA